MRRATPAESASCGLRVRLLQDVGVARPNTASSHARQTKRSAACSTLRLGARCACITHMPHWAVQLPAGYTKIEPFVLQLGLTLWLMWQITAPSYRLLPRNWNKAPNYLQCVLLPRPAAAATTAATTSPTTAATTTSATTTLSPWCAAWHVMGA